MSRKLTLQELTALQNEAEAELRNGKNTDEVHDILIAKDVDDMTADRIIENAELKLGRAPAPRKLPGRGLYEIAVGVLLIGGAVYMLSKYYGGAASDMYLYAGWAAGLFGLFRIGAGLLRSRA